MKRDITAALVTEHKLILRMLALLEKSAPRTARGEYANYKFYLDGVDFIRTYADRFHHAKEESVLFEALVANGMPRANSPVAAMLMEHDAGRNFVRAMEAAAQAAMAGDIGQNAAVAENALGYAALLREHIAKENDILYPLAERLLPETVREPILAAYRAAEAHTPADFTRRYEGVVARYEAETDAYAA